MGFKDAKIKKSNVSLLILIVIIVAVFCLFVSASMLNTLKSASIAEPISINIKGTNSIDLQQIKVYLTSFRDNEKQILINDKFQWSETGGWFKKIKIVVPENLKENIEEIKIEVGEEEFLLNYEEIQKYWYEGDNKEWILILPKEIRANKSLIPKLNVLINWPGDYSLFKSGFLNSIFINLVVLFICVLSRKKILKTIDKLTKISYLKNLFKKLIKLIKSQYIAIIFIVISIIIFLQPGQGNRGNIENIKDLFSYSYYIILNFFSFYNKNKFLDILQFIIGLSLIIISFAVIIRKRNFAEKIEREDIKKDETNIKKQNKSWIILIIFLVVLISSFIIHIQNRNNHFQECDSSYFYYELYNFPESAYNYLDWAYPKNDYLHKNIREFYISKISNLNLPHAIKSIFVLPFGSTLAPGVGFVYGLVSNEHMDYKGFMSRTMIITILIFHLSILFIFLLALKIKVKPISAAISSLLFLFSISMYSYGYNLGNSIWSIFVGVIWLGILALSYRRKNFLKIISLTTGILIFFGYLVVFYWAAFIMSYLLFFRKKMQIKSFMTKTYLCLIIIFVGAVLVGILGFAPSRHILFLAPMIFAILPIGIDDLIEKYNFKHLGVLIFIVIVLLGFLAMNQNLKNTSDNTKSIKIDADVSKIVIYDCSYNLIYKDWELRKPVEFANPNNFELGRIYLYLSQTTNFSEAMKEWENVIPLKIEVLESYENITNIYFIAYNPDFNKFKHNRPNNLFYTKFKVISMQ